MKNIISIILILFCYQLSFSQNSGEKYLKEGIEFHDNGEYDKAIKSYKKALDADPKSALINYEMALTYFTKGDYKEALKHADIVLDQKDKYILEAYITKGSALDMLGKSKESIKLFEKAIKEGQTHYLIYYNLALNCFKADDLKKAEENVILAIGQNPNHGSSHLMLMNIHSIQGNTVQTLLAAHYFLLIEPNSARSKTAYQTLQKEFVGNVSEDPSESNTINITLNANGDSEFTAVELMISLLSVSNSLEENKDKSSEQLFIENTESFFKILGEMKPKKSKEIWWEFYTPLFYDLAKSDCLEAYCYYISQSSNEVAQDWLTENNDELVKFANWFSKENTK